MNGLNRTTPPDYLIIGHITKDQIEGGYRLGGTAVYSGVLARRMGLKVALYTSGVLDLDLGILEGIEILNQPGAGTTTFVNEYTPQGRIQRLLDRAEGLELDQIPSNWKKAKIIHLAPVAREVPITAGEQFSDRPLGYSLQGWMRTWDDSGRISPAPVPAMKKTPGDLAVGFVSLEDLGNDRSGLEGLQAQFPHLALTLGAQGMEYSADGESIHVPAPAAEEVDPTGAGDIFAAAFLIFRHLHGKTVQDSAHLANTLAAASVTRPGTAGIPEVEEIIELKKVQR